MGTRCLTVFQDDDSREIAVMYRQFDGYLDGHGKDLATLLAGMKMVNGITDHSEKVANGMACLAAQVVAHFKKRPGGIYLEPAGTRDCGEDYIYFVRGKEGEEPTIEAQNPYDKTTILKEPAQRFLTKIDEGFEEA